MKFCELLNDIIVKCSCTAGDLCSGSDISPSTLRRYRSGEPSLLRILKHWPL